MEYFSFKMLEINNVLDFLSWNPEADGSAILTSSLFLENIPSVKKIDDGVTFEAFENCVISFKEGLSLTPLFRMNGGTVKNLTLDFQGVKLSSAIFDDSNGKSWGEIAFLKFRNVIFNDAINAALLLNYDVWGKETCDSPFNFW